MARVKEVTLGGSYTYQPEAYHSERAEYTVTMQIDENDDIDIVVDQMREDVAMHIALTLAEMEEKLHNPLMQGKDVKQLAKDMLEEDGMLEAVSVRTKDEEEDDEW